MKRLASTLFLILILLGGTVQLFRLVEVVQGEVPSLRAKDAAGEQKTIVILAQFPDIKHHFTREYVHRRVFVELNEYLNEASYGRTWLTGDTTQKWYTMPKEASDYDAVMEAGVRMWFSDWRKWADNIVPMVHDAINLADRDVDFSKFRRTIVVFGIQTEGTAWYAVGGGGGTGALAGLALKTPSGQVIRGACMVNADAHLGMFAHEFIHQLGGFEGGIYYDSLNDMRGKLRVAVDLYDIEPYLIPRGDFYGVVGYYPRYFGPWDPMSQHTADPKRPPALPSAFTKLRLGWIADSQVATAKPGEASTLGLDPLELPTSGSLALKIPLSPFRYYLIENRQQVGFDSVLPSSGVLVYTVDDNVRELTTGIIKLVDANPSVPRFGDAAFDTRRGKNSTFIDSRNNLAIILLAKTDLSYNIHVTTAKESGRALTVRDSLSTAENAILQAEHDGRTVGIDEAKLALQQAAKAFSDGDYDKAENMSRTAKSAAEKATKPAIATTARAETTPQPMLEFQGIRLVIPVVVLAVAVIAAVVFLRNRRKMSVERKSPASSSLS